MVAATGTGKWNLIAIAPFAGARDRTPRPSWRTTATRTSTSSGACARRSAGCRRRARSRCRGDGAARAEGCSACLGDNARCRELLACSSSTRREDRGRRRSRGCNPDLRHQQGRESASGHGRGRVHRCARSSSSTRSSSRRPEADARRQGKGGKTTTPRRKQGTATRAEAGRRRGRRRPHRAHRGFAGSSARDARCGSCRRQEGSMRSRSSICSASTRRRHIYAKGRGCAAVATWPRRGTAGTSSASRRRCAERAPAHGHAVLTRRGTSSHIDVRDHSLTDPCTLIDARPEADARAEKEAARRASSLWRSTAGTSWPCSRLSVVRAQTPMAEVLMLVGEMLKQKMFLRAPPPAPRVPDHHQQRSAPIGLESSTYGNRLPEDDEARGPPRRRRRWSATAYYRKDELDLKSTAPRLVMEERLEQLQDEG